MAEINLEDAIAALKDAEQTLANVGVAVQTVDAWIKEILIVLETFDPGGVNATVSDAWSGALRSPIQSLCPRVTGGGCPLPPI